MKIQLEWSELLIEKGKLDPLGLWRVGDRLIAELLPPFTTVVQQRPARYLSMYCWILGEAARGLTEKAKDTDFWGRFYVLEGIFLCATQTHDPHEYAGFGGRIGSEHASSLLQSPDTPGQIDFSVLRSSGIRNGWEVNYKGAMQDFHVTEVDYAVPGKLKLTEDGKALASAYERTIAETTFVRDYRTVSRIPKSVILELGHVACPCKLHEAASPALQQERREVKRRLVREKPTAPHENGLALWESLHLILDVLSVLSPSGIDRKLHRWRRLLTTELLPNGELYQPPPACLATFRKWQLYALDSLFTYSLESALGGFLEELQVREQMSRRQFSIFRHDALPGIETDFPTVLERLRGLQPRDRRAAEERAVAAIADAKGRHKAAEAFLLYCYCQANYSRLKDEALYSEATTFYEERAGWDGQELTLRHTSEAIGGAAHTTANVFVDLFLSEWVVNRQLGIRYQRNKELAWFSYNAETKTFDWEDMYHPTLYRAARIENLMGFLMNLDIVTADGDGWCLVPGALGEAAS